MKAARSDADPAIVGNAGLRPGAERTSRGETLMIDQVRVVLVVPGARSRQDLHRQLEPIRDVYLVEVCHTYQSGITRIAALVADLALVVVDEGSEEALALIETISESHPGVAVVAAGVGSDA